jgi:hypothetical protein
MTEVAIPVMAEQQQALVKNSILLKVSFGVLGNSKKADEDLIKDNTAKERFKIHKTLLDSPELKAIQRADQALKMWLVRECIPFEMGVMLLSSAKLPLLWERMTRYAKVERPALINAFVEAYPRLVNEAKQALGKDFIASEYPNVSDVRKRFYFDYKPLSFDVPSALKSISKEVYDTEILKAQANIATVTEEIQQAQRQVLLGLVETLDDQLKPGEDGKRKALHQGAITKLNKFLGEFHLENLTGDAETAALVEQLHDLTNGISAAGLKGKEDVKSGIAEKLLSIKEKLGTMVVVKTARKFKDTEEAA